MKTTKHGIFAVLMSALMVLTFIPAMAFAQPAGSWDWDEDYLSAVYTDADGMEWPAIVTYEKTDATCLTDEYTTYTAETETGITDVQVVTVDDSALGHHWVLVETKLVQGQGLTGYWECDRDGCDAEYSDNTMTLLDSGSTEATCFEAGTITKEGNVVDPEGNTVRIEGTRESEPAHLSDADLIPAVDPTCTDEGSIAYFYCATDDKYFDAEKNEISSDGIVVAAKGHDMKKSDPKWNADYSKCTMKSECKVCHDTVTETVDTTSEVTVEPTSTTKGVTTYTAKFENFPTQTIDVENVDYIYEPYWADDYSKCVAKCKGKEDVDAENITRTAEAGVIIYTATFAEGKNIGPFTATIEQENPMTAKAKTVKAKASKKTKIAAKKAFVVKDAEGAVTYKKMSGNKKISVAKNGKVTVKKGLKAGKTYKVKVVISAAGNDEYKAGEQVVTLKVKIKK